MLIYIHFPTQVIMLLVAEQLFAFASPKPIGDAPQSPQVVAALDGSSSSRPEPTEDEAGVDQLVCRLPGNTCFDSCRLQAWIFDILGQTRVPSQRRTLAASLVYGLPKRLNDLIPLVLQILPYIR